MATGQTKRTTRRPRRITERELEEQRQAAEDAIERNAGQEMLPSLKQRLVAIGHGARYATDTNTNLVSVKTAGYGDGAEARHDPAMPSVFDGLRLEDLSGVLTARTQEAYAVGRARGSDETRETWRGIMERERLETTAVLLEAIAEELAPILQGFAAPKGAVGDKKRDAAKQALVGLAGELLSGGRAVREALAR